MLRRLLRISAFTLLLLLSAATTYAQNDSGADEDPQPSRYSDFFTGAFHEYSIRGALTGGPKTPYDGWSLDFGIRHSFPMLLGDTRLSYRFDSLTSDRDSLPDTLEQHVFGVHVALHPLYLVLLGSDWLGYTISSLYFEIGGGLRYDILDARESRGEYEHDLGLFGSIGGGFDIPLSDPDKGQAPWLNAVYRYEYGRFERPTGESIRLRRHGVFLGLGWRINGLLF